MEPNKYIDLYLEAEKPIKYMYGIKVKENPNQLLGLRLELTYLLYELREKLDIDEEEYQKYTHLLETQKLLEEMTSK